MTDFIKSLAQKAGEIILSEKKHIKIDKKSRREIVTNADIAAEAFIRKKILEKYPDHHILGEEAYDKAKDYSHFEHLWVVDPIDGTTNFAQGIKEYVVSIAYYHHLKATSCAVFAPEFKTTYYAQINKGSYKNGHKLHVSSKEHLKDLILGGSFCYQSDNLDKIFDFTKGLYRYIKSMRFIGSAVLDFCYTAEGIYDGAFGYCLKPWDTAAGVLIAKEAGAITTKLDGGVWNIFHPRMITANPKLHKKLIQSIHTLPLP